MKKSEMIAVENYFEAFIIIFLISLFLFMISDFLISILFASSLVFLVYKPYTCLLKRTKKEFLSAFFMSFIVITILFVPFYFVATSLAQESFSLYQTGEELITSFDLKGCSYDFCQTLENNVAFFQSQIDIYSGKILDYLSTNLFNFFSSLTSLALNLAIFVLSLFFFLKDGEKFMRYVKRIIPMKNEYKDALFLRFRQVSTSVFLDSILIAILQGILTAIALYFTGFNSIAFWFVITSFLALLPLIGAAFVWIPAALYLLATSEFVLGIGLILYGLFIISTSDNIIRPMLMHHRVPIHPFLIFISILGGMGLFGFVGLFLGPIIISLLASVLQLYKLDFR